MIVTVCAIYDSIANQYGSPFTSINAEVAKRQIAAEFAAGGNGPMQTHPQDFKLFELGYFDTDHGVHKLHDQPKFLFQGTKPE